MAGILASSASAPMVAVDTAPSNARAGYVTSEQIALSVTPLGTTYLWGQAVAVGSAPAKSAITDATSPAPAFRPDVAGEYVITCTVDGTTAYVLRCSVVSLVATSVVGAFHFLPIADGAVAPPSTGKTLYLEKGAERMSLKLPDGSIQRVTVT